MRRWDFPCFLCILPVLNGIMCVTLCVWSVEAELTSPTPGRFLDFHFRGPLKIHIYKWNDNGNIFYKVYVYICASFALDTCGVMKGECSENLGYPPTVMFGFLSWVAIHPFTSVEGLWHNRWRRGYCQSLKMTQCILMDHLWKQPL